MMNIFKRSLQATLIGENSNSVDSDFSFRDHLLCD